MPLESNDWVSSLAEPLVELQTALIRMQAQLFAGLFDNIQMQILRQLGEVEWFEDLHTLLSQVGGELPKIVGAR